MPDDHGSPTFHGRDAQRAQAHAPAETLREAAPDLPPAEPPRRPAPVGAHAVHYGLALGLLAALLATAILFAIFGWRIFPFWLLWNLVWLPSLGTVVGLARSGMMAPEKWPWRVLKLRLSSLMFLIAYLGLLFGLGVTTGRVGMRAQLYHNRAMSAHGSANLFRALRDKSASASVGSLANANELQQGKIPEGLLPLQKDFLRSLGTRKTSPEYRAHRYRVIADLERLKGVTEQRNVPVFEAMAQYYQALADKYDRAERRPWLPVAPDPPPPK